MAKEVLRKCVDGVSARGKLMWELEGHRLVIGGNGRMRDFSDTKCAPWLSLADKIQIVVVEDGVENVGGRAFQGFTELREVRLGSTVARVGWRAFDGCSRLETVTGQRPLRHWRLPELPDVTLVGYQAFRGTQVPREELVVHDGVVLEYTGTDRIVVLPEGIREIAPYAFVRTPLESVVFPRTLERVGHGAFYATGLKAVTLPSKIQQVDALAFAGNPELVRVDLGRASVKLDPTSFDRTPVHAVKRIGRWLISKEAMRDTFRGTQVPLEGLVVHDGVVLEYTGTDRIVVLPEGICEIAPYAFARIPLESVVFPRTLERVGHGAFYATGLKAVTLPSKIQQVDALAFAGNPELVRVNLGRASVKLGPTSFDCTPVCAVKRIGRWLISKEAMRDPFLEVEDGKWTVMELIGVLKNGGVVLRAENMFNGGGVAVRSCFLDYRGDPVTYQLSPYLAEKGLLGEEEVHSPDVAHFRRRYADPDTWLSIWSDSKYYWGMESIRYELRYWRKGIRCRGEKLYVSWDLDNTDGPLELALCKKWLDEHPASFVGDLEPTESAT